MTLEDLAALCDELSAELADMRVELARVKAATESNGSAQTAQLSELVVAIKAQQPPHYDVNVAPAAVTIHREQSTLPPITGIRPEWEENKIVYLHLERSNG